MGPDVDEAAAPGADRGSPDRSEERELLGWTLAVLAELEADVEG